VYWWADVDDAELVALAQAGDVGAYEDLVRRHAAAALRLAHAVCGSAAEAEDAVQEAFVKAFHSLHRFRAEAPLRPWLMRIVANEAKNRRRSSGRRTRLAVVAAGRRDDIAALPEDAAVASDESRAVLAAVADLPRHDREVISYRYFAGLSERETAEALGCPPGTVKSRLARALERLRTSGALDALEVVDG
jgi:RNA polymerase sigma factor (sigma-70 family)